jgi:glycosyltransferase involved in cell wall biosynthesis
MKQSVLFIIDSLGCGGAEKSLVSLLPLLDYSRFEVSLSIICRGGYFERFLPNEVHLISFPSGPRVFAFFANGLFSVLRRLLPLLGIKRHSAELLWSCKRAIYPAFPGKYDVAIAYQQGVPTYYVARKIQAEKKLAWINVDMEKAGYRPSFNYPYYKHFSSICAVSNALRDRLISTGFAGKEQLLVVKDTVNVGLIRKLASVPFHLNAPSGRLKLLTVGRLAAPKNYPLAIETARLLSEKGLAYIWYFVGEGESREEIETLISRYRLQDRIVLVGFQPNPYPYFLHCDIYVQTSAFEGFGLTLSEAKALHKPIVTTDFPAAFDQIDDGQNGLIAAMTPEALAGRILSLIQNPSLTERLIQNTKQEQNRTMETECAKVNRLLGEN